MEKRYAGFTFWVAKWQSHTGRLSDAAYRAYHQLLCWMWENAPDHCSIPNDPKALELATGKKGAALMKIMEEIQNPYAALLKQEGNLFVSNGLRKEFERLKSLDEQRAAAGKRSAELRASKGNGRSTSVEFSSNEKATSVKRPLNEKPTSDGFSYQRNGNENPTIELKRSDQIELDLKNRSDRSVYECSAWVGRISERLNALEAKPTAETLRTWESRVKRMLVHPGGADACERILNEVESRRSPNVATTKGYSADPIEDEAKWANWKTSQWLEAQKAGKA